MLMIKWFSCFEYMNYSWFIHKNILCTFFKYVLYNIIVIIIDKEYNTTWTI